MNPRPLAPRPAFLEDASAPGSPRAAALWYPVGGIVFPDQVVQRFPGNYSLLDDGPDRRKDAYGRILAFHRSAEQSVHALYQSEKT